jgi:L-Ala-D/L-Glu epimerase
MHAHAHDLDLRTAAPFGISRWTHSAFANYVVELHDGELRGLGEAAPNRRYRESRADGLAYLDAHAGELESLDGPAAVEDYCADATGAGPALRAALSAAVWDLAGQRVGEPVWKMLGLQRPEVQTSFTIAIGTRDEMIAQARAASAYEILKVKLGFEGDLELAEALVKALPGKRFRFDANEGWPDLERAAASLERLHGLGAELVEQPLPALDLDGQAWLYERAEVALFADEALVGLDELGDLAGVFDGAVVKLAKAGGIASSFSLISACRSLGLGVLLGCMIESSLGVSAGLQLAGLADYVDLDGMLLLAADPFAGIIVSGDRLSASDAPGLGVRPRA